MLSSFLVIPLLWSWSPSLSLPAHLYTFPFQMTKHCFLHCKNLMRWKNDLSAHSLPVYSLVSSTQGQWWSLHFWIYIIIHLLWWATRVGWGLCRFGIACKWWITFFDLCAYLSVTTSQVKGRSWAGHCKFEIVAWGDPSSSGLFCPVLDSLSYLLLVVH